VPKLFIIFYLLSIHFFCIYLLIFLSVFCLPLLFACTCYRFAITMYYCRVTVPYSQFKFVFLVFIPSHPKARKIYFICPTFYRYTNVGRTIVAVSNCVHDSESLCVKRNTSSFIVISLNCSFTLPMKRNDCEESLNFLGWRRWREPNGGGA